MAVSAIPHGVTVRQLRETELSRADQIFRLAFGTFLELPDPLQFGGDANYVQTRWRSRPETAFAAEYDGELVGSNFVTQWGSVAFFGPLTIRPDSWDKGVGKRLLEAAMDCFAQWQVAHAGLFTFAHSPKHIHFYQKYGFWPRFLTAIMSKPAVAQQRGHEGTYYSALSDMRRAEAVTGCRELTGSIFSRLDLTDEISSVDSQRLGETVLVHDNSGISGFAICHCGAGTEAGSGACYIKFGAVRPGKETRKNMERLLDACETLAIERRLERVVAGMNLARAGAYQTLADRGFRTQSQGVAMERPNEPGYNRPDVYLIDDWR
jgi:GNAT superfamily N-acetyltransferase